MASRHRPAGASLLAAAVLLLAAACAIGPGGPAPDTHQLLRQSSQAMAGLTSVAADVKFGPGTTFQGFTLDSATSKVRLPADSDTTIKVRQQDFLVDVRVVIVNGRVFVKIPFGQFTEVTPQQATELPDVASIFDRRRGLPALLSAASSPKLSGSETVGKTDCHKVTATFTADQVGQALGGFKPAGDVAATLWIGQSDHLVHRVLLSGALVAGRPTSADITLRDFNAPVTIVQPAP